MHRRGTLADAECPVPRPRVLIIVVNRTHACCHLSRIHMQFYCAMGDRNESSSGFRFSESTSANNTVQLTFDGVERFLDGTFCRVYFVHQSHVDPYADTTTTDNMVFPYYETIGDST